MTVKQKLHRLIDELSEGDLRTAERVLEALRATVDPVKFALDSSPQDDEEDDEDDGLKEARRENSISHTDARRELLDD